MALTDIITPAYIRALMPAVKVLDENKKPVSDSFFWPYIDAAISDLELRFAIVLRTRGAVAVQRFDALVDAAESWNLLHLRNRPVQTITSFDLQIGAETPDDYPPWWPTILNDVQGQIQIIPSGGGSTSRGIVRSADYLEMFGYMPGLFRIGYTAGFERDIVGVATVAANGSTVTLAVDADGEVDDTRVFAIGAFVKLGSRIHRIESVPGETSFTITGKHVTGFTGTAILMDYPPAMVMAVAYGAAIPILDYAGAHLYGAGVTSKHVDIDALSQKKSYGAGPLSTPYSPLANRFQSARATHIDTLAALYTPMMVFAI